MHTDKLSNYATTVSRDADSGLTVFYHSTCIVQVDSKAKPGMVTLRSGGWQTATTKRKMNQASSQFGLAYCVYQTRRDWFVDRWIKTDAGGYWADLKIPFEDGMSFPLDVSAHIALVRAPIA